MKNQIWSQFKERPNFWLRRQNPNGRTQSITHQRFFCRIIACISLWFILDWVISVTGDQQVEPASFSAPPPSYQPDFPPWEVFPPSPERRLSPPLSNHPSYLPFSQNSLLVCPWKSNLSTSPVSKHPTSFALSKNIFIHTLVCPCQNIRRLTNHYFKGWREQNPGSLIF